jgi:hypothetical protein
MEAAPVLYLSYAREVTGDVLHAHGGAQASGRPLVTMSR